MRLVDQTMLYHSTQSALKAASYLIPVQASVTTTDPMRAASYITAEFLDELARDPSFRAFVHEKATNFLERKNMGRAA